ncbi:MAG TPA: ABC transporter permease [Anaerolineales bacterium]
MGLFDLIFLIFDNLGRRKARVALTAVGVIIGSAAVVVLVSLAIGLQRNATQQLGGIGDLTQIQVMPNYGSNGPGMPEKAVAVRVGPGGSSGAPANQKLVTDQTLSELAALPGVVAVIPRDYLQVGSTFIYDRLQGYAQVVGMGVKDLSVLGLKAQGGSLLLERGTAIVGAKVASNFNDPRQRPGQQPSSPPDLLNANLKLTLSKYVQDGQGGGVEVRKSVPLRVIGVIAESRGESDYTIYLPMEDVAAFNQWATGRRVNRNRDGYSMAIVKVDDVAKVLEINDSITALGYQAFTPQSFVQGINSFYLVLQIMFGGVGAIALLVAAIGIANTMAMAILERTREIGLMKAVGATNRDVLSVFLGEAAGIGLVGGLGGVLLGWAAGQVINVLAVAYLAGQAAKSGGPPPTVAVYTPAWLPIFALVFATLIGLLSGLYPALRAATLIPVNALKYE